MKSRIQKLSVELDQLESKLKTSLEELLIDIGMKGLIREGIRGRRLTLFNKNNLPRAYGVTDATEYWFDGENIFRHKYYIGPSRGSFNEEIIDYETFAKALTYDDLRKVLWNLENKLYPSE